MKFYIWYSIFVKFIHYYIINAYANGQKIYKVFMFVKNITSNLILTTLKTTTVLPLLMESYRHYFIC